MVIEFELTDNPYVTTQEKGINWRARSVYEKHEVRAMKDEYKTRIRQYLRANGLEVPRLEGTVALKVCFYFKTIDRRSWGCLKETKPDNDNAVKGLQDCLADLGFFHSGDQQVADLHVLKFWASSARVRIESEEVRRDLFRT